MLIILLLLALIRTLRGVPIASPVEFSDGFPILDIRDTQTHFGQRGVNDIIISCFATIFACTWSAVHPNIPAPTECWWTCFKRQTTTMIYALLAPEAVSAWALKQRLSAKVIMDKYNKTVLNDQTEETYSFIAFIRGVFNDSPEPPRYEEGTGPKWTLTHGFFVQMGGFVLCDRGKPMQTLTLSGSPSESEETNIAWNIEQGIIERPLVTEDDIEDRSKGDAISKTLVVLQTIWFISQCIARWSAHLPVTELEVVTLGFAILNAITYGLWWYKPQDAGRPVFLEMKIPHQTLKGLEHGNPSKSNTTSDPDATNTNDSLEKPKGHSDSLAESWLRKQILKDFKNRSLWKAFLFMPLRLLEAMLRPLSKMAAHSKNKHVHLRHLRVAMFDSGEPPDPKAYIATIAIGVLFGAVHLISGWFLDFVSREEMWLWRASSIIVTFGPIFLGTWSYLEADGQKGVFVYIMGKICIIGLPFYILSRIAILTQSLISLRALPPAALQTIDWTTFLPHL